MTASFGYTPAEQKRTVNNLMLAAIDYPEDLETHLERTIIRTESGIDLIPCNKRVADAAARLQVMQMSQYNAMGAEDRACEKVLAVITDILRSHYDYIIVDCGLKYELLTDIYFDFGKVPVGFQSVSNPTLSVMVNGNAVNGYYMTNRADVGGKYLGTWQTANASWVTIIQRYGTTLTLPKTGY